MVIKRWVKNFFGFSRSQVNAFMILLPLMTILIFSEPFYHWYTSHYTAHESPREILLDSLMMQWNNEKIDRTLHPLVAKASLFNFDPNIISREEFLSLGFSEKISGRIINYRKKGGRFRIKSDLLKMYGMDSSFYHRLYTYIQLPEKTERKFFADTKPEFKKAESKRAFVKFDLNMADTAQLKKVYGIGEKRALRIVAYREKLGGFIDLTQLTEIYTLDSAVIGKLSQVSFIIENFNPQKIHINTVTDIELATHPYLRKSVAKAIVAYRFQHGKFNDVEDLRKIQALDATTIQKITRYLDFE
jgi:competence protein ComEA